MMWRTEMNRKVENVDKQAYIWLEVSTVLSYFCVYLASPLTCINQTQFFFNSLSSLFIQKLNSPISLDIIASLSLTRENFFILCDRAFALQ